MDDEARSALDGVAKLDLENGTQFTLLVRSYKYNMRTINFWLNYCVFPRETKQFPSRIMANAWDLTDGGRVVGFSGTKDNKLLLPAAVTQVVPDDDVLAATDGKMLALILDNDAVHVIRQHDEQQPYSSAVLKFAVDRGTVALIAPAHSWPA